MKQTAHLMSDSLVQSRKTQLSFSFTPFLSTPSKTCEASTQEIPGTQLEIPRAPESFRVPAKYCGGVKPASPDG